MYIAARSLLPIVRSIRCLALLPLGSAKALPNPHRIAKLEREAANRTEAGDPLPSISENNRPSYLYLGLAG